jgi:hypothetical protein
MKRILRRRPSPATAIASAALLVALGGTSYAAATLPVNSVGTAQLRENAVVSTKVKNGSLLSVDFRAGQLPAGPRGATGPAGPAGPPGPQGMTAAFALVDPNGGSPRLITAHTNGFVAVGVGPFGPGDYCLTPAPGVDVADTAAVASVEAFYSYVFGIATVRYPTAGPSCAADQLEVKTFTDNPTALSNEIGFTVLVP